MKRILLFLCLAFRLNMAAAQNDSCSLQISMLTCSPGEDLYSIFGHTALRVKDDNAHSDIVYNYGTFDFDDPDFYTKFLKGNLLYSLSAERMNDFLYSYRMENRGVTEQILKLNCEEKQRLYAALKENALEENRHYQYDFIADNCSTRPKDIVVRNNNDSVLFRKILPEKAPSFRDLLHEYLDKGQHSWSKLGIDMLLGSKVDRNVTNQEAMFLPDYLMKGLDSAYTNGTPLVLSKHSLFPASTSEKQDFFFGSPFFVTMILLILITTLTFIHSPFVKKLLDFFDIAYFLILGLLGCLLLFMWFGTHHRLFGNNYNLLWAIPTHLPAAFLLFSGKKWVASYFKLSAVFYLLLIMVWAFLPQSLNMALFPVALLAGIRSFARSKIK